MKVYTAAPPDVLRVDEKNLREYSVLNCVRRASSPPTTKRTAFICPPTIGRHYVAWANLDKDVRSDYWSSLWRW